MANIDTQVVEGMHADECLMIVSGPTSAFVIVKGAHDNIAVELNEDGWHALAVVALNQTIKSEVPEAVENGDMSLVTAWVEKAMLAQSVSVRDLASRMRVDVPSIQAVLREEAHFPESILATIAHILNLPLMPLEHAARLDRETFPDRPDTIFAFGGEVRERRGVNRPKPWTRKVRDGSSR